VRISEHEKVRDSILSLIDGCNRDGAGIGLLSAPLEVAGDTKDKVGVVALDAGRVPGCPSATHLEPSQILVHASLLLSE